MRKIGELETETVRFSGFVETWNQKKKGNFILFSKVSIFKYKDTKEYKEDHLWIRASDDLIAYLRVHGRLSKMDGLAKVVKYTRKDGSTDFTLESVEHRSIDEYYKRHFKIEETYKRSKSAYKKIACIEVFCILYKGALDDFEKEILLFPSIISPKELVDQITNCLNKYLNDYKLYFPKYLEKGHPKAIKYRKEIIMNLKDSPTTKSRGFKNEL